MARQPRFVVPGIAQHVIQRGNNRSATFCDALDYHLFLEFLRDACQEHECSVHAYVLMTNHVHLLMTPQHEWGISKVMQCVGRRYVGHYNKRMARTGGLWEGRYRASLIDTETYLFRCMRYIELNPVRACMVAHPRDYRWSSYHANARGYSDVLVTPHQRYLEIASERVVRVEKYARLFNECLTDDELAEIRHASNHSWVLGDDGFASRLGQTLRRRVVPSRRCPRGEQRFGV